MSAAAPSGVSSLPLPTSRLEVGLVGSVPKATSVSSSQLSPSLGKPERMRFSPTASHDIYPYSVAGPFIRFKSGVLNEISKAIHIW